MSDDDMWSAVLGHHGLDVRNQAGEDFLIFAQLLIMNTWFQKKRHCYGSWVHPGTRCGNMIDFVVVHSSDCQVCMDTQVMRGATCWSDHYLLGLNCTMDFSSLLQQKC